MKFFIDTANVEEIKKAIEMGFVDGVTTNPSLLQQKKEGSQLPVKKTVLDCRRAGKPSESSQQNPRACEEARKLVPWVQTQW